MYKLSQSPSSSGSDRQQQQPSSPMDARGDRNDDNMGDSPERNKGNNSNSNDSHQNPCEFSVRPPIETSVAAQQSSRPAVSTNTSSSNVSKVVPPKKQSFSGSGNSRSNISSSNHKSLPPLFLYMEMGDFQRAAERAKNHPREVRTWATIKIKSSFSGVQQSTKRLALHQACFKVCTFRFAGLNRSRRSGYEEGCHSRCILFLF